MEQNKKKIAAVLIALVLLAVLLVFGRGAANNAGPQGTTSGETIAADPVADRNNGQEQGKENTSLDGKEQSGESAPNTVEKQTAKPASSPDAIRVLTVAAHIAISINVSIPAAKTTV